MFSVRFHFLLWTAVTVSAKEPLYGKIGDEAVITPDSVVNPITSIVWIHGSYIAMDWYGGEISSYRHFTDRGKLNTSTGALTITGLTRDDSGTYTVEINDEVASKTELLVISPVSKPTVSVRCEPEMTYCNLTCSGSTIGAEPVTYRWTSGDITWPSTKEHKITKENKEPWFSCAFENPVSFSSSEKVFNPFINRDWTWLFILISLLVVCIIIIIIYFICKWRTRDASDTAVGDIILPGYDGDASDTAVGDIILPGYDGGGYFTEEEKVQLTDDEEPAERKRREFLEWRNNKFLERLEKGEAAEREVQEYLERLKKEYLELLKKEFLEWWNNKFLESLEKVISTISEVHETQNQDLGTAESPETSNETERAAQRKRREKVQLTDDGEALLREWKEFLEWWNNKKAEWEEQEEALLKECQEKAQLTDDEDTDEMEDQEEPAQRKRREILEWWNNKRSATSAEVPETSTKDQETAESPDPSNETEKSAVTLDDPETCRLLMDEQTAEDEAPN